MFLNKKKQELFFDDVSLSSLAEQFDTPLFIYSKKKLLEQWRAFSSAITSQIHIHYAVKANSQIYLLKQLNDLGAGFDIVSGGELARVLKAGVHPKKIIFSGVGKTEAEMISALNADIACFNVESIAELNRIHTIASHLQKKPSIALRFNPDIDAGTHAYISTGKMENKFGLPAKDILSLAKHFHKNYPNVNWIGLSSHIGSQITELAPFIYLNQAMMNLYQELIQLNVPIKNINLGGGLGIRYKEEHPPSIAEYVNAVIQSWKNIPVELSLEPGRILIAEAGILLTRVQYIKSTPHKKFAVVDAGMNDLMRPSLYHAWHSISPVFFNEEAPEIFDIVGPVCESSDCLGADRLLSIKEHDLLIIECAGAYGSSMSSNYNGRLLLPEVWIDGSKIFIARRRQTLDELFMLENF